MEEVIRLEPAVIVAGAVDAVIPARKATTTIPIVTAALSDPVRLGLIKEVAHPGTNVTGITTFISGLTKAMRALHRMASIGTAGEDRYRLR